MTKRADTTPAGSEVEAGPIHGYAAAADESGQGEAGSDRAGSDTASDGDDEDDLALEVEVEPPERSAAEKAADKIAELEAKQKDTYDRYLRSVAEVDNVRKRGRKETEDARVDAQSRTLREMLPVVDNLERALGAAGETADAQSIVEGVRLVLRQFHQALERFSVTPVPGRGAPFDPTIHEAVSQRETAEHPPGTVVEALQTGYRIGERLLRPALVVVAKPPPAPAQHAGSDGDGEGEDGEGPAGPNGRDPDAA